MAETPSSYKRFAQSDKISQGTTNAALSLNDYLPGQHVTGPNNNDIAATLAQVQAIPIGTATLSGNTYNVTISNYPNTATIYPGQKISVKFNADAPTADDTALNLSAFGQSLPLCARGVRMGQGAIKSGMILELVYRGDMWNANYDVVQANRGNDGYTTFADGTTSYSQKQINNLLSPLRFKRIGEIYDKTGYAKIEQIGYYARPLVYLVLTSKGVCDILIFGNNVSAKKISLGTTSSSINYKYINPPSNYTNGYLYISTNVSEICTTIFSICVYQNNIVIISNSDETEFNSGKNF